LVIYDS